MEPSHPLQAGFGIKGQGLSSLLPHNLLDGQFLLKVSQGREEPSWSGCVMRSKEHSLLFLPSQIWEWPQEWRTRQLFTCLWPRGKEGDYGGGVGDTWEWGVVFFFHLFPKRLWLFWFTGGGNKAACLKGLWSKHTQGRLSPALSL